MQSWLDGDIRDYRDVTAAIMDLPSAKPETHEKRTETSACDLRG